MCTTSENTYQNSFIIQNVCEGKPPAYYTQNRLNMVYIIVNKNTMENILTETTRED